MKKKCFNSNGIPKEEIKRTLYKVEIDLPRELMHHDKVISRETFDPIIGEPIEEQAAKYSIRKRLASGVYHNKISDKYKLLSNFKLDKFNEVVKRCNDKTMVFYESKADYLLLKKYFNANDYTHQFFNQKVELAEVNFIIGQYESMSRGIDLKDLRNLIFFSPTDKFKSFKQAQFRIGRANSYWYQVNEYRLIVKNSVQEKI